MDFIKFHRLAGFAARGLEQFVLIFGLGKHRENSSRAAWCVGYDRHMDKLTNAERLK